MRYLKFFTFLTREEIDALARGDRRAAGTARSAAGAGPRRHRAGARRRTQVDRAERAAQVLFSEQHRDGAASRTC